MYLTPTDDTAKLKDLFHKAMEIWLPELPNIQLAPAVTPGAESFHGGRDGCRQRSVVRRRVESLRSDEEARLMEVGQDRLDFKGAEGGVIVGEYPRHRVDGRVHRFDPLEMGLHDLDRRDLFAPDHRSELARTVRPQLSHRDPLLDGVQGCHIPRTPRSGRTVGSLPRAVFIEWENIGLLFVLTKDDLTGHLFHHEG